MNSARPSVVQRVTHVATPLASGLAAFFLHRTPAQFTMPAPCPGLSEWAAIALARVEPTLPLGLWLLLADRFVFAAGVAVFSGLVLASGAGLLAALAASSALLVLPILEPRLAPFWSAGLLLGAATFGSLAARRPWLTVFLLAAGAGVRPQFAAPFAVIAAVAIAWRFRTAKASVRLSAIVSTSIGILTAAGGVVAMIPTLAGDRPWRATPCALVPHLPPASSLLDLAGSLVHSSGPYALALAALGVYAWRTRWQSREARLMAAFAFAPIASTFFATDDPVRMLSPAIVGLWMLAAAGLRETFVACRARRWGVLAVPIFAILVPFLVFAWRTPGVGSSQTGDLDLGHARLARIDIERIRAAVPETSAYVVEDATVDLLLRASGAAWSPAVPVPEIVPVDAAAIGARLGQERGPLFALPLAQALLQNLGFKLSDIASAPGVAAVELGAPCAVVGTAWRDLAALRGADALAIVALEEDEGGPIVIYVQTAADVLPHALGWPQRAIRGMVATVYLARPADRERLARDAEADGLTPTWLPTDDVAVARLELWRIPDAPKMLAVSLNAPMARAIGHVIPDDNPHRLRVCPSFPYGVRALEPSSR